MLRASRSFCPRSMNCSLLCRTESNRTQRYRYCSRARRSRDCRLAFPLSAHVSSAFVAEIAKRDTKGSFGLQTTSRIDSAASPKGVGCKESHLCSFIRVVSHRSLFPHIFFQSRLRLWTS